jgi:hypothetical protein
VNPSLSADDQAFSSSRSQGGIACTVEAKKKMTAAREVEQKAMQMLGYRKAWDRVRRGQLPVAEAFVQAVVTARLWRSLPHERGTGRSGRRERPVTPR